jgi:hypothetical protein
VPPALILKLFAAIVRPIFEYSAVAHITAVDCHKDKMQVPQNSVIRSALHIPTCISVETLHDASSLLPLHEHMVHFAKKRLATMKSNSPIIADIIEEFEQIGNTWKHKSPIEFINS